MAKDPAILFYTSDFLTGTATLTDEQVGQYIRLLCLQHQKGGLTKKDMLFICKRQDEDIFSKFKLIDGLYFNGRMAKEAEKRANYSKSRSDNRKSIKDKSIISSSYVPHMENANENTNVNVLERGIRGEVFSNVEDLLLANPIEFERIVMVCGKTAEQGKVELRKYHLWMDEKEHYPKPKKSLFSGFEKWLMNAKTDKN